MKSEFTGIDWDNLEPGTALRVVSSQGFSLQQAADLNLDPDLNPRRMFGISMRRGDVAIFLGYDRKRNWEGETGVRHLRMLAKGQVGWYDIRAMDSMFRILKPL